MDVGRHVFISSHKQMGPVLLYVFKNRVFLWKNRNEGGARAD